MFYRWSAKTGLGRKMGLTGAIRTETPPQREQEKK
jgi:hypothetical protein